MKPKTISSLSSNFESLDANALARTMGGAGDPNTQIHPPPFTHLGQTAGATPSKCGNGKGNGSKGSFANAPGTAVTTGGVAVSVPAAVCPKVPQYEFGNR